MHRHRERETGGAIETGSLKRKWQHRLSGAMEVEVKQEETPINEDSYLGSATTTLQPVTVGVPPVPKKRPWATAVPEPPREAPPPRHQLRRRCTAAARTLPLAALPLRCTAAGRTVAAAVPKQDLKYIESKLGHWQVTFARDTETRIYYEKEHDEAKVDYERHQKSADELQKKLEEDRKCIQKHQKSADEIQKKLVEDRKRVQIGEKLLVDDTAELEQKAYVVAQLLEEVEAAEKQEKFSQTQLAFWSDLHENHTPSEESDGVAEDCEQEEPEVAPNSGEDRRYENIFLALGIILQECDKCVSLNSPHAHMFLQPASVDLITVLQISCK